MSTLRPFQPLTPLQRPIILRRKCFISYLNGDRHWAQDLVTRFGGPNGIFIPRVIGLDDDAIQSMKPDYVIDKIREDYISGSTVSIVLLGPCTHSRRFVDWEIKRGLLNGNGLLGIMLPPHIQQYLPERFASNWRQDDMGYGALRAYPSSGAQLQQWIDEVLRRSTIREKQVHNAQDVWSYNRKCSTCGFTH